MKSSTEIFSIDIYTNDIVHTISFIQNLRYNIFHTIDIFHAISFIRDNALALNFHLLKCLARLLQLFKMGNQNRKAESGDNLFDEQLQILKWRGDVQHNSHIARTLVLPESQTSSMAFQKVITAQLSKQAFIDLSNLQQLPTPAGRSAGWAGILVFEDYVGSLVGMEDCLSMEENIYVLMTLLFGQEKIYQKFGKACVHESCCHLTAQGELRAWVSSDPTCCRLDPHLIRQEGKNKLTADGRSGKVLCSTEASICKAIIAMTLRLSDKSSEFVEFHRDLSSFVRANILQNANFVAIRTFINGFVYRNRLILKSNILSAMGRVSSQQNRLCESGRNQMLSPKATNQHEVFRSQQFSLKSRKMQLPMQEQHPTSNLQLRMPEYRLERSQLSHHQPRQSLVSQQKPLKPTEKSVQTSQIQMQSPKKFNHFSASNQLMCSEIIKVKATELPQAQIFKESDPSKLSKRMNVDDQESEENKSIIFKSRFGSNSKKLVRFHSHNPTYDDNDFNSLYLQQVLPEKQMDYCTHNSLTQTQNHLHIKQDTRYGQTPNNKSEFSNSQFFSQQLESRTLTRVVSRLISNKQIDLCESAGSFQSLENSSKSDYQGVLMGMGRSVVIMNEPSKRRGSSNCRGFSSSAGHTMAHLTF